MNTARSSHRCFEPHRPPHPQLGVGARRREKREQEAIVVRSESEGIARPRIDRPNPRCERPAPSAPPGPPPLLRCCRCSLHIDGRQTRAVFHSTSRVRFSSPSPDVAAAKRGGSHTCPVSSDRVNLTISTRRQSVGAPTLALYHRTGPASSAVSSDSAKPTTDTTDRAAAAAAKHGGPRACPVS